jgi:FkbM family methyltransferase
MEKHISSGSAVYDIGANYGVHTFLMAKLLGPLGHVYAFEPIPEIMACLRENVELNGFSNVTCVELALGDRTGWSKFARGIDSSSGRLVGPGSPPGGDLSVGVTTLDEYVLGEGHRAPCFVKLDVEGAESLVLSGAKGVLKAHPPTLLVELHNPTEDVHVGGILSDLGYVAVRTCDGCRRRVLARGWPEPDGLWGQVIAFRSGSEKDSCAHS